MTNWPLCGKCNKPVEKLARRIDFWTGNLIYIVECHGQMQVQHLPCPHDMVELMAF